MIDALGRPVHLVGHSYGGAVALRVARERPGQIASMILYEPVALHVLKTAGEAGEPTADEVGAISAAVDCAILAGDHRTRRPAVRRLLGRTRRVGRIAGRGAGGCHSLHAESSSRFPRGLLGADSVCGLPAVSSFRFCCCKASMRTSRCGSIARRLAQLLRCCSLQTIDGAGHMGPLTHADVVARLMAAFIERHDDLGILENKDAAGHRSAA